MKALSHKLINPAVVRILIGGIYLDAELSVPQGAKGLVIFAHGSGSSRLSPRNRFVAQKLRQASLATLLVDLLTEEEDTNYETRFDIRLLTERLAAITDWASHNEQTKDLAIGYFGASTGAAAAMLAAETAGDAVKALVLRGGRVDLGAEAAESLHCPTLLIVGQEDYGVLEANEEVFFRLGCKKELAVIPKATHLFEEPGALDRVAQLASKWFQQYLGGQ